MAHLNFIPEQAEYIVTNSDKTWLQHLLTGGLPKSRRDLYDPEHRVEVAWYGNWVKYRYLRDFYESNQALDGEPFTIDLAIDGGNLVQYEARFEPRTWQLSRAQGGSYIVKVVLIVKIVRGVFGGGAQRVLRFDDVLDQLLQQIQALSDTEQTPRWEPDSTGVAWYVRPLVDMAVNPATADRFTAEDPDNPGTTFFNHPLPPDRTVNPIEPSSVTAIGYPNKTWTGPGTSMTTAVFRETDTFPGTIVYYMSLRNGPGFVDPLDGVFKGTATVNWMYADLSTLDGTSLSTAWPGLAAIDWDAMSPGDELWVCGEYENETLQILRSGAAGAYIKIRLNHPTFPCKIRQAQPITDWTADSGEYWAPLTNVTECMLYEDDARMYGINVRSRCRSRITAYDLAQDTVSFTNIRRIQTGDVIDIGSDFVWQYSLPVGLTPNTRYYAVVVSSTWAFYSVSAASYVVRLATSEANALSNIYIDLTADPPAEPYTPPDPPPPTRNAFVFVQQHDYPFYDPEIGSLSPGQYAVDCINQIIYYKPTTGLPGDHDIRVAAETYSAIGACIYGAGVSYIKITGGADFGGLFGVGTTCQLGLAHQNVIEFQGGTDIVVDGVKLRGGRSGVTFLNTVRGTVRNSEIYDVAHHACGGEGLTGSQEPYLLLECNNIHDIGNRHEFGDAQALVTNPHCDHAIFRRNYVYGIGQNIKVTNPAPVVFDGSDSVSAYLNWFDFCHGKTFELGAGDGEPAVTNAVIFANVVTRQGQLLTRSENLVQRVGVIHTVLNGLTDPGVASAKFIGNLVAWSTIGNRAPDTLDDCAAVYQRNNNNTGSGDNIITRLSHNAFLQSDGPIFGTQRQTSATEWPEKDVDWNIYASVIEFAIQTSSGTILQTWDSSQIKGLSPGYWTVDTGLDLNSEVAVLDPIDTPRGPTLTELEALLTKFREFDTYDQPTEAMIGNFPFADVV